MKTSVNGKYYLSYKIDSGKETFIAAYKVLRKQETKENMNGRVVSDIQIQAEGDIQHGKHRRQNCKVLVIRMDVNVCIRQNA